VYEIKQLAVQGTLVDQVASLQVTQTFRNPGSVPIEAAFVFPLPYEGVVDRLTFLVDGKEYEAKALSADEARRVYESYVRRQRDPALLEWIGTGLLKTSVFPLPPGAERTVTLRFSQVCRQTGGVTELLFPWSAARYTAKPIEKLSFQVALESAVPIRNVYSPSHLLEVKRSDERHAVVSFAATNESPRTDIRLLYGVGREAVGAKVLSYRPNPDEDGYFLMMATPAIEAPMGEAPRKNLVFVVDRSGSMSGPKIEQAKNALKFVLNNLREGDLFNIVAYDMEVSLFKPEMQRYSDATRGEALGFVEGLYAGGSTNIDGALRAAFPLLADASRPNFMIFLTDGLPTVGVTNEGRIAAAAREANRVRARMFVFGVGYDVNSRLLDTLARDGFGQTEYVRPSEDIETHISRLYNRVGQPALSDVEVETRLEGARPEQGPPLNRVYPKRIHDLYMGDTLVVVGRYKTPGKASFLMKGKVQGQPRTFSFEADLIAKSPEGAPAYMEKLWAVRRVGEIIDQIDVNGPNKELTDELVTLGKRHGILTPFTSFLADDQPASGVVQQAPSTGTAAAAGATFGGLGRPIESAGAGRPGPASSADAAGEASSRLRRLAADSGKEAFSLRANKGQMQAAAQAPAAGGVVIADSATDGVVVSKNVQNLGDKTFYFRDGRWVDSLAENAAPQTVRKVQRFSDEYFALARKHGRAFAQYLALEGTVRLRIGSEVVEVVD
jgi:Ca-activated chloride channel family protein